MSNKPTRKTITVLKSVQKEVGAALKNGDDLCILSTLGTCDICGKDSENLASVICRKCSIALKGKKP